jgi:hypothetical protein
MKNFKTHIYVFRPSILGLGQYLRKRKIKVYQQMRNMQTINVDAEANYRVSNSKFQIEQLHLTT